MGLKEVAQRHQGPPSLEVFGTCQSHGEPEVTPVVVQVGWEVGLDVLQRLLKHSCRSNSVIVAA